MSLGFSDPNRMVYESSDVVNSYIHQNYLDKPETSIINLFKDRLKDMKMLDIGVGAGRTTYHFAGLVKEYVGIDYSPKMIETCHNLFSSGNPNLVFKVCDVRSMDIFADNYFDFILFSFNGLDSISHADRLTALREIRRVAAPGGYFCFSSHNILALSEIFKIGFRFKFHRELRRVFKLRFLNEKVSNLIKKDYAMVTDAGHDFRIKSYYINPEFQIRQLYDLGFTDIRLFSLNDGKEITTTTKELSDSWIYYLCKAAK